MASIKQKNTKPEKVVFKELAKRKIYFKRHYRGVLGTPDIAVPRKKIAIFIDGDFWHGYSFFKLKRRLPKKYWLAKIKKNIERDRKNSAQLRKNGWKTLRVWEHELLKKQDKTIERVVSFLSVRDQTINLKPAKSRSKSSTTTATR